GRWCRTWDVPHSSRSSRPTPFPRRREPTMPRASLVGRWASRPSLPYVLHLGVLPGGCGWWRASEAGYVVHFGFFGSASIRRDSSRRPAAVYTCIFVPNLCYTSFIVCIAMYSDGSL